MLAVTLVLEAADRDDADVVRRRLIEFLLTDAAVVVASAPFPVAAR